VYDSIKIKSDVVNRDEKEKGERRILNFGHTIGHAVEKVTGISHGKAVSIGMAAAAALSEGRGLLSHTDKERIIKLIKNLRLPVGLNADRQRILDAMKRDKKREGNNIHFILLHGLGNAVVEDISIKELEKYFMLTK
jgi:3-dehydroquinate synthase